MAELQKNKQFDSDDIDGEKKYLMSKLFTNESGSLYHRKMNKKEPIHRETIREPQDENDNFILPTTSVSDEKPTHKLRNTFWTIVFQIIEFMLNLRSYVNGYISHAESLQNEDDLMEKPVAKENSEKPRKCCNTKVLLFLKNTLIFRILRIAIQKIRIRFQNIHNFFYLKEAESATTKWQYARLMYIFRTKNTLLDNICFLIVAFVLLSIVIIFFILASQHAYSRFYTTMHDSFWEENINTNEIKEHEKGNIESHDNSTCVEQCTSMGRDGRIYSKLNRECLFNVRKYYETENTSFLYSICECGNDFSKTVDKFVVDDNYSESKIDKYLTLKSDLYSIHYWYIISLFSGNLIDSSLFKESQKVQNYDSEIMKNNFDIALKYRFNINEEQDLENFCKLSSYSGLQKKEQGSENDVDILIKIQRIHTIIETKSFFPRYMVVRKKYLDIARQVGAVKDKSCDSDIIFSFPEYTKEKRGNHIDQSIFSEKWASKAISFYSKLDTSTKIGYRSTSNPFFGMNEEGFLSSSIKCINKEAKSTIVQNEQDLFTKYTSKDSGKNSKKQDSSVNKASSTANIATKLLGNFVTDAVKDITTSIWDYVYEDSNLNSLDSSFYMEAPRFIRNLFITKFSLDTHSSKHKLLMVEKKDEKYSGGLLKVNDYFLENTKTDIENEWISLNQKLLLTSKDSAKKNTNEIKSFSNSSGLCMCGFHFGVPLDLVIMSDERKFGSDIEILLNPKIVKRESNLRDGKTHKILNTIPWDEISPPLIWLHEQFGNDWLIINKYLETFAKHSTDFMQLRYASAVHESISSTFLSSLKENEKVPVPSVINKAIDPENIRFTTLNSVVEFYKLHKVENLVYETEEIVYKKRFKKYSSFFNVNCIDYCALTWAFYSEQALNDFASDSLSVTDSDYVCKLESENACIKNLDHVANK